MRGCGWGWCPNEAVARCLTMSGTGLLLRLMRLCVTPARSRRLAACALPSSPRDRQRSVPQAQPRCPAQPEGARPRHHRHQHHLRSLLVPMHVMRTGTAGARRCCSSPLCAGRCARIQYPTQQPVASGCLMSWWAQQPHPPPAQGAACTPDLLPPRGQGPTARPPDLLSPQELTALVQWE